MNIASGDVLVFQFPSGHPKCGWEREFCQIYTGIDDNTKASIVISVAAFSMIVFPTLIAFQRYR